MQESTAQDKGYRPAYGKACRALTHASTSENEPVQSVAGPQCGFERWPVKILTDQDSKRVDFTPTDSSVAKLNTLKVPGTYPYDRRLVRGWGIECLPGTSAPHRDARRDGLGPAYSHRRSGSERHHNDCRDPAPFCALGSGHEKDYETARAKAQQIPLGALIEVEGVGFFDIMHGQSGVAKNGFEIHPVLKITQVQAGTTVLH
jgi:hypothetical protein